VGERGGQLTVSVCLYKEFGGFGLEGLNGVSASSEAKLSIPRPASEIHM
jgi:hypothetical protein